MFSEPLCKHSGVKRPSGAKNFYGKTDVSGQATTTASPLEAKRGPSKPRVVSFFFFRPFQPNPGANCCCASLPILRPTLTPTWKLDFIPYTVSSTLWILSLFLFSGCGLKAGGGSSRTFCRDCPSFLFTPFFPFFASRLLYSTAVSFSPASQCREAFQFPLYTIRISVYSFSRLLSYKYGLVTVILSVSKFIARYDKWTY